MKSVFKYFVAFIFFIGGSSSIAQVTVFEDIEVSKGLMDGTVTVEVSPAELQSEAYKVFDSEDFIFIGGSYDSVSVKLIFDEPMAISKSKAFFVLSGGAYTVEAAGSIADFDAQSGTYQKLIDSKNYSMMQWDSTSFDNIEVKVIRLIADGSSTTYIGEWALQNETNIISLAIYPDPPKLLKNTSLKLKAVMVGDNGKVFPYSLNEDLTWSSDNNSVASFKDENSNLSGNEIGTALITVQTLSSGLSGAVTAQVVNSINVEPANKQIVKVAVVYQDPMVAMGQRLHQRFGWDNPVPMVNTIIQEFSTMSHGVIEFQVVESFNEDVLFSRFDGELYTVSQLVNHYTQWDSIKKWAEKDGRIKFDYKEMLAYYDFYNKRESGTIDEVWVYAHPFAGMYESQMVGEEAFWYNSPPITDVPEGFTKLISIMGWNYERGVAEALHSVGHRAESAMRKAYGRWDIHASDPNDWELYTRFNMETPGQAHIGNIHFPPNGIDDYDYGNPATSLTYAQNWFTFPYLLDEVEVVTCSEWGCDQLGYMRYWFGHLPHFKGSKDGILNNWWHYIVDYEGAVDLAKVTPMVGVKEDGEIVKPETFKLEQNYPNPFNPYTIISYSVTERGRAIINIYNSLGQLVEKLLDANVTPGSYQIRWNPNAASGVYFYKLDFISENGDRQLTESKKMVYLK